MSDPGAVTPFPPVGALLPHSGRMLLLDEVVSAAPDRVACRVTIREGSTFAEGGRVPGVVALEYMAQAVGVYAGLRARGAGEPVRIGFLLGTRRLTLPPEDFRAGDELLVEARHEFGDEQIGAFECTVTLRGVTVAEGCLKVFQGDGGMVA
jgi:predicted hotdog family 3-hydroxylacyl-ACP dehydratase